MNRTFIWCLLSEKRLLKKISYVVVLLMVPLFVLTMKRLSEEEAGILNIGLYSEDVEGSLSDQIIERLLTEESIFRFMQFDSEEQAVKALRERKVDAVWIFPEKLYEKIHSYPAGALPDAAGSLHRGSGNGLHDRKPLDLFGSAGRRYSGYARGTEGRFLRGCQ